MLHPYADHVFFLPFLLGAGEEIIGPLHDAAGASEALGYDAGIGEIERLAGRGDPRLREDKPA